MTHFESSLGGSSDSGGSLSDLIQEVRDWLARYVFVLKESDLDLLALWAIHTWVCEETYTTPRLWINSPVPGSGKTTLLEHLFRLCRNPMQMSAVSSAALLARVTAAHISTLLIDEADRSLDPKRKGVEELFAHLNSGYKKGGTRPILNPGQKSDWEVKVQSTFSPVAIAGNSPQLPEDTRQRCIVVRLMPDIEGKVAESDWELIDPIAKELAERIELVTNNYRERIRDEHPSLPKGCVNRIKERWKPLKRIGSVAGNYWADKVDEMILEDLDSMRQVAESGDTQLLPNVQLSKDLFQIYEQEPGFHPTTSLVQKLIRLNPEQWSRASYFAKDLTAQRLGQMLNRAFDINSMRLPEGNRPRGYNQRQFEVVWRQLGISLVKPTEPPKADESDGSEDLF
jgi:hypothetical protein